MGVRERSVLTEYVPKPVDWLWKGFVPFGYLSLLIGPQGVGKSALALAMAARVSHDMNVVIVSTDDGIADVILPRLNDADPPADLSRIWAIDNARDFLDALSMDPKLVIIDPLPTFLFNKQVRQEMNNLAKIASDMQTAYILIQSVEFDDIPEEVRLVRSIMEIREGEDDTRVLTSLKNTLGPRPQPFVHVHEPVGGGFRVIPASRRGAAAPPPEPVYQQPALTTEVPPEPPAPDPSQIAAGRSRVDTAGSTAGLPPATVELLNKLRAAQGQGGKAPQ